MNCCIRGFDSKGERVLLSLTIEHESEALAEAERLEIRSPDFSFTGCERPPLHPTGGACQLKCSISGIDEAGKRRSALLNVDSEAEAHAAAGRMGIKQPRFRWYGHWPPAPALPDSATSTAPGAEAAPAPWGHLWEGLWVGFVVGFIANFRPFRRD